ncbi:MAG: Fe2+-dependent dioxygenase [Gammaproteobacteria bacterium]
MLLVEKLLSAEKAAEVRELLASVPQVDGRDTAGPAGQAIKSNLQYDVRHTNYQQADAMVRQAMFNCEQYQLYAFPHKMAPVRFAKYTAGMEYGEHLDAAVMPQANTVLRADLSFTVFLSAPEDYDGGELVVNLMGIEHSVKANCGDMFVYPSGNRHRVNVVTRGAREVGVGWVQSVHRSAERRLVLNYIRTTYNEILQKEGKTEQFDRLNSAVITLERMWADV